VENADSFSTFPSTGSVSGSIISRDLQSFEIRFESAVPIRFESHGPIWKVSNLPCLPIARRSQTTQTINGTQWYSIQTR